jgi:antitoxin component YwqK of YwqJK toxin-antitoxin module
MKTVTVFLIILFPAGSLFGQNRMDDHGRRTGPWKMEYPDGTTRYEGSFLEGRPVGLMIRYDESGEIRAKMMYDTLEDRSSAVLYYKSGKIAAEGNYIGREKDSVWTYYSEYDGSLRIRENYLKGALDGLSVTYYPEGGVSEELMWNQGSKEGKWIQYYEDGTVRLRGNYAGDQLNGPYEVWNPEGLPVMSGTYVDGTSHGTWSYFDEKGALLYSLEYDRGKPVDQEKYLEIMKNMLDLQDTVPQVDMFQQF